VEDELPDGVHRRHDALDGHARRDARQDGSNRRAVPGLALVAGVALVDASNLILDALDLVHDGSLRRSELYFLR
jgi:hypothetical protein